MTSYQHSYSVSNRGVVVRCLSLFPFFPSSFRRILCKIIAEEVHSDVSWKKAFHVQNLCSMSQHIDPCDTLNLPKSSKLDAGEPGVGQNC